MSMVNEFQKGSKWIVILTVVIFLQTTVAIDRTKWIESKKINFQLMRWFSKTVKELFIPDSDKKDLKHTHGLKNKTGLGIFGSSKEEEPIRTLADDHRLQKFHLTILQTALTMKNAIPGLAILQLKHIAIIHEINYVNCVLFSEHYSLSDQLKYCREMALAFLDFISMGTDVLCTKLAAFFETKNIKNTFKSFSGAVKTYDTKYRTTIENAIATSSKFEIKSDRYHGWCNSQSEILRSPMNKLDTILQIKKGIYEPWENVPYETIIFDRNEYTETTWENAHMLYKNANAVEGEFDLMKALFVAEMQLLSRYNYFDERTRMYLKSIEDKDFKLDETVRNHKIVVTPIN